MASELARRGRRGPASVHEEGKKEHFRFFFESMLGDIERVRAALRAGARPELVYGKDSLTRRALKPDTIAHGPDGDVLVLAHFGRVTMLGRLWDEQRAEQTSSRSPCGQREQKQVLPESKGAITGTPTLCATAAAQQQH